MKYTGIGVTSGVAQGEVVTSTSERMLEDGYIVVVGAKDASPSITQLIQRSAGVVTEGGPLSHGAVLCRALGIPCVSSVDTNGLVPGAYVTVDGDAGIVYKH